MGGKAAGHGATPLRRQYLALKRRHPDAVLFFRLGDFYETFDGDAELAARVLQITLTSREMGKGQRVPMAGVPFHAAEHYIARLIAAGHKVAVCEQIDPAGGIHATNALSAFAGRPTRGLEGAGGPGTAAAKGMMAREVVRVVTPGTVVEPRMLDARRNNYICALVVDYNGAGDPRFGLAHADLTTGEFATTELDGDDAAAELARELDRLQPAECLVPGPAGRPSTPPTALVTAAAPTEGTPRGGADAAGPTAPTVAPPLEAALAGRNVTPLDAWRFELDTGVEALCRLFGVANLAGFGCAHLPLATRAAGALVAYVEEMHRPLLALLDGLRTYEPGAFVRLDGFTRRNLELTEERASERSGTAGGAGNGSGSGTSGRVSLLGVLDDTRTPMGGRLLRRWLGQPLMDLAALRARHDVVAALVADGVLRGRLRTVLGRVADVERLTNRARQGTAQPRDLLALRASLLAAAELQTLVEVETEADAGALSALLAAVDPCADAAGVIGQAVYEGTPGAHGGERRAALGTWDEERLIRPGYSEELDELVRSSADARTWIAGLEGAERERTGIKSLKVGFNKVFGYYLHLSHAYKGEVPAHYIRRQTLTDGERYITPELKEYENLVLHAQERIGALERELFAALQRQIAAHAGRLLRTAGTLAQLDVLAGFAEVAMRRGYVRPELDEGDTIEITAGRHPVVEAALEAATTQVGQPTAFVPNDCRLSCSGEQIAILTGPNMSGKSTALRSVALIVLLAQAGSFVPAGSARIGLVDRIFTRVGAQDDLAAGQSTFMVEMVETASILRHATPRSLVILDEIGRGTSTYDGVAIAQAVVEYLHEHVRSAPVRGSTGGPQGDGQFAGGPRTLFATHYHELADLERTLSRVRNYRVEVLEEGDRVVFLHQVVRGSATRSYGIHVARLAGVPRPVTQRAEAVLAELEVHRGSGDAAARVDSATDSGTGARDGQEAGTSGAAGGTSETGSFPDEGPFSRPAPNGHARRSGRAGQVRSGAPAAGMLQLSLFAPSHPLVDELKSLDVMNLTPLDALNRLADLVERARRA